MRINNEEIMKYERKIMRNNDRNSSLGDANSRKRRVDLIRKNK